MSFTSGAIPSVEYEFFAENTIVSIIPEMRLGQLNLIQVRRRLRARASQYLRSA